MMFLRSLLVAMTLASHATAETYVSDAFGLAPASALRGTQRANWAGVQEHIGPAGSVSQVSVGAGQADTLLLFVGPKSAVAGKDRLHAVSLGLDPNGNLLPENVNVSIRAGQRQQHNVFTRFGIADILFLPPPQAGLFHAGASTDARQSARAEYRVVPDLASVGLRLAAPEKALAKEAFADVRSSELKDGFGNPIGDGVGVLFRIDHETGETSLATGQTIADMAKARLLTRGMAGSGRLQANLGSRNSAPVPFITKPLTAPVAPEVEAVELADLGALRLRIGPFLSDAGYFLNDGAPVSVTVTFKAGGQRELEGWLRDGFLDAIVPGSVTSFPAEFTIRSETGVFRQRLASPGERPSRSDWGLE